MLPVDCVRLYDIMKSMKCDIYHIYKNVIIGIDKFSTSLSEVICDTKVEGSYEIDKDTMKLIADKCQEIIKDEKVNAEYYISRYSQKNYRATELEMMYMNILSILSSKIVPDLVVDSVKSNEEFMKILSNKSADGANFFKINDKYIMSIYSGLLPINKSDKVSLEIYNIDEYSYISKFIINKGKFVINKFIKYLFI